MTIMTFHEEDAKMLSWVAAGAESTDPGSFLIFDIHENDSTARISTNTATVSRSMTISVDYPVNDHIALRAKTIASITSKVEEGINLTIMIDEEGEVDSDEVFDDATTEDEDIFEPVDEDDEDWEEEDQVEEAQEAKIVKVACGATSLQLTDMYAYVMDVTHKIDSERVAVIPEPQFIASLAKSGAASPRGEVTITIDDDIASVGARAERIHTQELYPATSYADDLELIRINGAHIKAIKPLAKLDYFEQITILVGSGCVSFKCHFTSPEISAKDVIMTIPTVVSAIAPKPSPCDEDINPALSIDKSILKDAMSPLSGATSADSGVSLRTNDHGNLIVSVISDEGSGKTTVLDSVVHEERTFNVALQDISTALKSVSQREINIGYVDLDDASWMTITPIDDDAAEDDELYTGGDIVIAIVQD